MTRNYRSHQTRDKKLSPFPTTLPPLISDPPPFLKDGLPCSKNPLGSSDCFLSYVEERLSRFETYLPGLWINGPGDLLIGRAEASCRMVCSGILGAAPDDVLLLFCSAVLKSWVLVAFGLGDAGLELGFEISCGSVIKSRPLGLMDTEEWLK